MGAAAMGVIPKGNEGKSTAKRVTQSLYMPADLLEELKEAQHDLEYDSFNSFALAVFSYFLERHKADKAKGGKK